MEGRVGGRDEVTVEKNEREVDEGYREITWGKNEMNVEGESYREGSDVSHPRGPSFTRKEREGIGGENERESLTVCKVMEVNMQTVSA